MRPRRGKHSCRFCDKRFDRPSKLTCHEATHKDRPFLCRFCNKSFRDSHMANTHVFAFHKHEVKNDPKQPYFKMTHEKHSGKTGRRVKVKHRHVSKLAGRIDAAACRNYLCDCGLGFQRKSRIKQHQMYCQIHTNRVKARESEKNESQQEQLLKKSKSNISHEFRCDRCSSTFRSMESLQEHKRHIHNRKKAQPSEGHIKRTQKATTSTHSSSTIVSRSLTIKQVSSPKKCRKTGGKFLESVRNKEGACSICGKFLDKRYLDFHRKHHILAILNTKYRNELKLTTQVLYLCRYETCNKAFLNKQKLSSHEVVHLGSKPFMCDLCDNLFQTESQLEKHVSTCMLGLKDFACWYCGKLFGKDRDLTRHEETHVKKTGAPYLCGHCSKSAPTRPEINQHHFDVHQNLKPQSNGVFYKCKFCSKEMPSRSKLLDHAQSDHWSEIASTNLVDDLSSELTDDKKQWECNQCTKTFDQKIILTEHEKSHSAHAPFNCNRCERQFLLRMALKRHSRHCPSAVASSTEIHEEASKEHDEDIISISSSSPSPSPPASPEMQSVQIQRLKAVPLRKPGSTEVHHQFTVPMNGDCAGTGSSAFGSIAQPRDQIYLIQYSSELMTHGPLTISLPDINTSRSAIRILPPEGVSPSVPIPVKLERVL